MNLFYHPNIDGDTVQLDEQESKHAVRVLRLGSGDRVELVDGRGGWYGAVIEVGHPKKCLLRITSRSLKHQPMPYNLHMAVSPTKQMDRFEWFVEKATEIGISGITPLMCQRTERSRVNTARLERILVSAMKQSMKAWKPDLSEAVRLEDFIEEKRPGICGIAHCQNSRRVNISTLSDEKHYTLLIGPEGDFTEEEVRTATGAGYIPFRLGDSRLRTETAAVYSCAAVSFLASSGLLASTG